MTPPKIRTSSPDKSIGQIFEEIGLPQEEFHLKGCVEGVCVLETKENGIQQKKQLKGTEELLAYANRWLQDHPGAAKKRGINSNPLFAPIQRFVLLDVDDKQGWDGFLFRDSNGEWKRFGPPVESAKAGDKAKPSPGKTKAIPKILHSTKEEISSDISGLQNPNLESLREMQSSTRSASYYREQGVVFGREVPYMDQLLILARESLPPEEFHELEKNLRYEGKSDSVHYYDENRGTYEHDYLYRADMPLILATLKKIETMDWKALGFPEEKLSPVRFMKAFYPFTVKKDPSLPNILSPLHEIHLAGHPEIKISWSDPYLRYCYKAFLSEAGLFNGAASYWRQRIWQSIEEYDGGSELSLERFNSNGARVLNKTIQAPLPKAKGFQLVTPENIKIQPFQLTVHGRTVKIFAPHADEKTIQLIKDWGRFISHFPEVFIPPVADRLIKKDRVAIELSPDNLSFTIKWDNPIANALAAAYPIELPKAKGLPGISAFVFQQAQKTFITNAAMQEALAKYYFDDATKPETIQFTEDFWHLFAGFMEGQYQEKPLVLKPDYDSDVKHFHWLHLAKYFSDYGVDRIGNISKQDLFKKTTFEEMAQGFIPNEWEESSHPESRFKENKPQGTRAWQVPIGLGAQAHYRESGFKLGPRLQAQIYAQEGPYGLGLEAQYSWFRDGENSQHRLGLLAGLRLQKEIVPLEEHLMGGIAVWAGLSMGAQIPLNDAEKMRPLGVVQVGARLYDRYSLALDAQSNGTNQGASLGLSLQIRSAKW